MEVFGGLALILGLAAVGGVVARSLRQPALLGYVVAGVVLSTVGWGRTGEVKAWLEVLGQLGVTFLLFLVGVEMPIWEIKKMGKVALATGVGQIVFTSALGFLIVKALGYSSVTAMYLSIALAFSSTIVVIKLLSEKRDLQSLYGKIAVGFLLVQDFVAIGILVVLAGVAGGGFSWAGLVLAGVKILVLVAVALGLSVKVMPRAANWVGRDGEMLFVVAVAWCMLVAAFVASPVVGFGMEIGGFLAGIALANTLEHTQISARIRPLRDFFLTLFFVALGAGLGWGGAGEMWGKAAVLSVFVLVGNPVIVMAIMGMMGYRKRTSFLAGLTVAQISEFSLIVVAMAVRVGYVEPEVLALTTLVGVVTMTASTYMILHGDWLYRKMAKYLGAFERRKGQEEVGVEEEGQRDHIVLLGYGRTGERVLKQLEKLGEVWVVDFDPGVVERLRAAGKRVVFGDMSDYEMYGEIGLEKAKLVVSTVPVVEDGVELLAYLRREKMGRPTVVLVAVDEKDAQRLYKLGADLVVVPNRVGGEYLAEVFEHHGWKKGGMTEEARRRRSQID